MKAKQLAEETGNIGGIEISEREEHEAENNIEKLQAVSRFNTVDIIRVFKVEERYFLFLTAGVKQCYIVDQKRR